MIPEELNDIVRGLLRRARDGDVHFTAAADLGMGGEENDIVVSFPDYSVNVFQSSREDSPARISFNIVNSNGRIVAGFGVFEGEADYELLSELLELGTRRISGIDDALAQIRRMINEPGTLGTPARPKRTTADDFPF